MKETELRIGNLIQTMQGNIGKVTQESLCDKWLMLAEGIPLTEKLLVEFGFEDSILNCDWLMLVKGDVVIEISKTNQCEVNGIEVTCEYVHQLQNLYHALTGEEL